VEGILALLARLPCSSSGTYSFPIDRPAGAAVCRPRPACPPQPVVSPSKTLLVALCGLISNAEGCVPVSWRSASPSRAPPGASPARGTRRAVDDTLARVPSPRALTDPLVGRAPAVAEDREGRFLTMGDKICTIVWSSKPGMP
jgi:hypothetical protein